jgi:hypothetical protein
VVVREIAVWRHATCGAISVAVQSPQGYIISGKGWILHGPLNWRQQFWNCGFLALALKAGRFIATFSIERRLMRIVWVEDEDTISTYTEQDEEEPVSS